MPYKLIRGFSCYYEDRGQGEPVLLLHGAVGSAEIHLAPQIEEFSRHYQVIAPDMRGYGRSRPPEREFLGDFYTRDCEDMATLMKEIGVTHFCVAGWSDGGNIALLLAIHHPDLVKKLIVWGANSYFGEKDIRAYEESRDTQQWPEPFQKQLANVYGEPYWRELWNRWCDAAKAVYAAGGNIMRDRLDHIYHPTLILHGTADSLVPFSHAEVLYQAIHQSRLEPFSDGGHWIHLKHAADFNRRVLTFLKDT